MTKVQNPIVIVGTGRCGSTLLHRVLALHSTLGWLSTFNEVFPKQTWLSCFSNLYRTPIPANIRHLPFFPKPFEAYKFWEQYLPNFGRRDIPQTPEDVPESAINPVREVLTKVLRYQGRERLLIKVTGWSRIALFNEIFPDARFIFLNRDHRSVVSSWIQAGWLDVTSSIDSEDWQWGEVPPPYRKVWQDLGMGPILSAAVKIQLDLDDIHKNMAQFPDRCYRLEYKDFVSRPGQTLQGIAEFCGLPWLECYQHKIASLKFYDTANKWRKYLSASQGALIQKFFQRAKQTKEIA